MIASRVCTIATSAERYLPRPLPAAVLAVAASHRASSVRQCRTSVGDPVKKTAVTRDCDRLRELGLVGTAASFAEFGTQRRIGTQALDGTGEWRWAAAI